MQEKTTESEIDPEALEQMRERGGMWAAYRNIAMDSVNFGHLYFINYGPGCTHETPPKKAPDTSAGLGWRYQLEGKVNLETGAIEPLDSDGT